MNREFKLWLLATVTCSVLAAAVASTRFNDDRVCWFGMCGAEELQGLRVRENVTRGNMRRLASAYRDASDMALAARVLTAKAAVGEPELWFAPDVPDVARRSVKKVLDLHKSSRGAWHGKGPVAVMVITDTAQTLAGHKYARPSTHVGVRAILPSPETGGRCVAVVRLRGAALRQELFMGWDKPLLDACAFFDAFGEPGPRIRATLDSAFFISARVYLPAAPDSVRRVRDRSALLESVGSGSDVDLYRCSAGQLVVCDSVVLAAAATRRSREFFLWASLPTETRLPVTAEDDYWRSGALVDAIAANLGPDRFQQMWISREPLADAYRSVAGQAIGQLVYDIARERYRREGPSDGPRMRPARTGAAGFGSGVLTLAVVAGLLLAASRTGRPTVA